MVQATAVTRDGRTSPDDSGIRADELARAFRRVTAFTPVRARYPGAGSPTADARNRSTRRGGAAARWSGPSVADSRWPPARALARGALDALVEA